MRATPCGSANGVRAGAAPRERPSVAAAGPRARGRCGPRGRGTMGRASAHARVVGEAMAVGRYGLPSGGERRRSGLRAIGRWRRRIAVDAERLLGAGARRLHAPLGVARGVELARAIEVPQAPVPLLAVAIGDRLPPVERRLLLRHRAGVGIVARAIGLESRPSPGGPPSPSATRRRGPRSRPSPRPPSRGAASSSARALRSRAAACGSAARAPVVAKAVARIERHRVHHGSPSPRSVRTAPGGVPRQTRGGDGK